MTANLTEYDRYYYGSRFWGCELVWTGSGWDEIVDFCGGSDLSGFITGNFLKS